MQVEIYKSNLHNIRYNYNSIPSKKPIPSYDIKFEKMDYRTSVAFRANANIQKTITTQIQGEKTKLINKLKEVLSTEVLVLSEQEKLHEYIEQYLKFLEKGLQRRVYIANELKSYLNSKNFTKHMSDNVNKLKKEFNHLQKQKFVAPKPAQPSKDNYDYVLVNKFKNAIIDGNYDLDKIEEEHYSALENINTINEFKKKYISIRIPSTPIEVIADKIIKTLNVDFYCDLDDKIIDHGHGAAADFLIDYFKKYSEKLLEQFPSEPSNTLLFKLEREFDNKVLCKYEEISVRARNNDVVQLPKQATIAKLNETDIELLNIDFNKFVLDTIKKMYLERKKINEIQYQEGDKTINISSIKASEYKFEKIPEKMKKFIQDAKKIKELERSYEKYTNEELKNRLNNYLDINIEENEKFFNTFLDFNNCKFTDGDRQYLIKFLHLLDKISDKELSVSDAYNIIQKENIKPYGTIEFNIQERKRIEEDIKLKHKKRQEIVELKKDFDKAINSLYDLNLSYTAEKFSKYYPESLTEENIEVAKNIIKIINDSLKLGDAKQINTRILRLEILNNFKNNEERIENYNAALKYAEQFSIDDREERAGQYLLNSNIIATYPDSLELFSNQHVLKRIMEKLGDNGNEATIALCKYENYLDLKISKKQSILDIIDIFDLKNPNDKIVLKDIIENNYINCDTVYKTKNDSKQEDVKTVIVSKCKREIYEKYKFPNCIDYFKAFEIAMKTFAAEKGFAGIKKTGLNNNSIDYKMELKIKNYTDRLFSSNNDYVFDIYSEKGLH
jgi:hypothetical protein